METGLVDSLFIRCMGQILLYAESVHFTEKLVWVEAGTPLACAR